MAEANVLHLEKPFTESGRVWSTLSDEVITAVPVWQCEVDDLVVHGLAGRFRHWQSGKEPAHSLLLDADESAYRRPGDRFADLKVLGTAGTPRTEAGLNGGAFAYLTPKKIGPIYCCERSGQYESGSILRRLRFALA
jgi:hypothetical protein